MDRQADRWMERETDGQVDYFKASVDFVWQSPKNLDSSLIQIKISGVVFARKNRSVTQYSIYETVNTLLK